MNTQILQAISAPALILAAVLLVGAWLLRWAWARSRSDDGQGRADTHELLTNFRELHARGGLSDEEYRTIKTKLANELQPETGGSSCKR